MELVAIINIAYAGPHLLIKAVHHYMLLKLIIYYILK